MLSELDESVRQLLVKEGRLDPSDIDVSFDIPHREWSAGISKPTINCYLFDIRENRELRQSGLTMEGRTTNGARRRREPMRVALTYLVTAWTRAVEDEHRLLFHALRTLMRFSELPAEHVQGALREHDLPILTQVAQPDGVLKSPGEFWTALENHLKPSINYVVNLALDYDRMPAGPPVLSAGIRFRTPDGGRDEFVWFGGTLRDAQGEPIVGAEVCVEKHRGPVWTDADGRYRLRVPAAGRHVITARVGDAVARQEIEVPSLSFDLTLPTAAAATRR